MALKSFRINRVRDCFVVLVICLVSASYGQAQDLMSFVRKQEFQGLWAGHKVVFSVQEVHSNHTFDGVAEHLEGGFKGIKFGFHGKISPNGSLVMVRYVAGDKQVSETGPPSKEGNQLVWTAPTKGIGIPPTPPCPFKIIVPIPSNVIVPLP